MVSSWVVGYLFFFLKYHVDSNSNYSSSAGTVRCLVQFMGWPMDSLPESKDCNTKGGGVVMVYVVVDVGKREPNYLALART